MREILFRGKRKDLKGWTEGHFFKGNNNDCYIATIKKNHLGITETLRVKEKTVGQYTGSKDCEGKRIFEGDICNLLIRDSWPAIAKYDQSEGAFKYFTKNIYKENIKINISKVEKVLIIGNIHDNPELLEV